MRCITADLARHVVGRLGIDVPQRHGRISRRSPQPPEGPPDGGSRERRYTPAVRFDPEYVSQVLNENFEDAKALFLSPLMAIHYAHLVMLADRGIVTAADARALRDALDAHLASTTSGARRTTAPARTCSSTSSACWSTACGEDVAGRLHTARSRNDIDMTMYRMRQREFIARADRGGARAARRR